MNNDELDDAIDAAVRRIMRTEPPAGLRARVMRRLEAPPPGRLLTLPRLAAATAFAVFVIAGVLITRDRTSPVPVPVRVVEVAGSPAEAPAAPAPPDTARIGRVDDGLVERRRVAVGSTGPRVDDRVVLAMSIDDRAAGVSVAPLTPLVSFDAAPLAASPVRISEIAIRPLPMDPLRFDPLLSPPR